MGSTQQDEMVRKQKTTREKYKTQYMRKKTCIINVSLYQFSCTRFGYKWNSGKYTKYRPPVTYQNITKPL